MTNFPTPSNEGETALRHGQPETHHQGGGRGPKVDERPAPTTPPPKRLRRFKRSPNEVSFLLTPRDLEILRTLKSFRLMDSAHIQALAEGSDQSILRRLQKLFH